MVRKRKSRDVSPSPVIGNGGSDGIILKSVGGGVLKLWDELEVWQQEDNHHIETGYRHASNDLLHCVKSWAYWHNETVNIYSHVLGSLLFLSLPIYFLKTTIPPRYSIASAADKLVFLLYFVGVAICFALSATYHTVMSHSQKMDAFGAQLDFQGVILLMWGAGVPLIYYGFECDAWLRKWYWGLLSVLAMTCSVSTFQPRFRDPYLRSIRALTFGSLALFFLVPILHGIQRYGWAVQSRRMGIVWVLVTLGLNVTGAVAYAVKFPERWCKRRFDLVGASHQIFHVLVVLAALVYLRGLLQAFDFVHGFERTCSGSIGLESRQSALTSY